MRHPAAGSISSIPHCTNPALHRTKLALHRTGQALRRTTEHARSSISRTKGLQASPVLLLLYLSVEAGGAVSRRVQATYCWQARAGAAQCQATGTRKGMQPSGGFPPPRHLHTGNVRPQPVGRGEGYVCHCRSFHHDHQCAAGPLQVRGSAKTHCVRLKYCLLNATSHFLSHTHTRAHPAVGA